MSCSLPDVSLKFFMIWASFLASWWHPFSIHWDPFRIQFPVCCIPVPQWLLLYVSSLFLHPFGSVLVLPFGPRLTPLGLNLGSPLGFNGYTFDHFFDVDCCIGFRMPFDFLIKMMLKGVHKWFKMDPKSVQIWAKMIPKLSK